MSTQAASFSTPNRRVLAASTLAGDKVKNVAGESLGKIEEIMIDLESGEIAYAVLSFGGFLGMGDKLFAVPWSALEINAPEHEFVLDIDKQTLENAPGFDKDNWPDMADPSFGAQIHTHYGEEPYWERESFNGRAAADREVGSMDADVTRERLNQPDLPEELRRRPTDLSNFPGSEKDADLKVADPSRTYAVNDTNHWTRKS